MSKKEGKGLKSFNKGFQVPDTYIIIFLVVVVAALLTFLVPKGFYETQDISYMINGDVYKRQLLHLYLAVLEV